MAGCEDCAKPAAFWDGEPTGKEFALGGVNLYLAEPDSASGKAVILVPDIRGWEAKNIRLIADKLAKEGYTSALPDLFKEDWPNLEAIGKGDFAGFQEWVQRKGPDVVLPDLEKVIAGLQSEKGVKSVGVIGFCWGARFALHLGRTDKVKAVVMNHGSFIDYEDISKEKQPLLINASDNDRQISREKLAQFQGLLEGKKDLPSDVKFYPGMNHGWTCKGDASDPKVGPQIVDAHTRAVSWFHKHL